MFQYMNRLNGFMYTVRLLRRWSVTSSASPLCWVRPVMMWCHAPYMPRQADDHRRQDAARGHAGATTAARIDHQPDASRPIRLAPFGVGNERRLLCRQPAGRMDEHVLEGLRHGEDAEEVGGDVTERGRPVGNDLGITPDDDRVGVMAGMAPSPDVGSRMIMKQAML